MVLYIKWELNGKVLRREFQYIGLLRQKIWCKNQRKDSRDMQEKTKHKTKCETKNNRTWDAIKDSKTHNLASDYYRDFLKQASNKPARTP